MPFWLLLELTPTKLPHYPLPLFPAITVLIALTFAGQRAWSPTRIIALSFAGLALLGSLFTLVVLDMGDRIPRLTELNVSQNLAAGQKISRLEAIPGYNYSRGAQINMLVVQVVPSLTP